MRVAAFVAILLVLATVLSGCNSSGGDGASSSPATTSPTKATGTPKPTSTSNETEKPNIPPVLVLTVTNETGAHTNVTTVGHLLTFDASKSTDADGKVTGAAVQVILANQTATNAPSQKLFDPDTGLYTPATFNMSFSGRATVIVFLLDDNAGFASSTTYAYVDQSITPSAYKFNLPAPSGADPTKCQGTLESQAPADAKATASIADSKYFHRYTFSVPSNVTYVEAKLSKGTGNFAICGPDLTALSAASTTTAITNPGVALPANPAYNVAVFSGQAPPATDDDVEVTVVIHFGPRPA